jgi:hypothetical protein
VPPSEPLDPSLSDWRYPQESDIKDDWDEYRIMFPEPFHVKGDFDGNGVVDDVWILLKKESKGWGVFVFMRGPAGKKPRIIKIHSSNEEGADEHGLFYYPPQVLETACTKGIKGCKEGQMRTFELKRPAFLFFEFEAETKLYSWDPATKSFKMILRQAFGMPAPAVGTKSDAHVIRDRDRGFGQVSDTGEVR